MDTSWIQTIVGIFAGWQLPNIVQLAHYWAYLKWRPHFLEGDWHCYHYSVENGWRIFRHEVWSISRRSLGGLLVLTTDSERPNLLYRATIRYEKGYVLLNFSGVKHEEEWQARLSDVIPGKHSYMRGIMVAVDFDRNSYSTPVLVTSSEMHTNQARKILDGMTRFDRESLSLRVTKNLRATRPSEI